MILVILGVTIALVVLGVIMYAIWDSEVVSGICGVAGAVGFVIAFIACVALCVSVSNLKVNDDKIAMYQEENVKIETQIAETVQQYQQYESDIFKSVTPDSAITLVALYPELKADTLVQKQLEIYIENNDKIKELKESKISGSVSRWWLYFGG